MHLSQPLRRIRNRVSLLATLAGTEPAAPHRKIRTVRPRASDWAADPARVGHEPGYTWVEPDAVLRCVHCGNQPCQHTETGHHLKQRAA